MASQFPTIHRIQQIIDQPEIHQPCEEMRSVVLASRAILAGRVPAGGSIAITVGSRGIAGLPVLVKAMVDALQELSYRPFVVAAMGSHGGATEAGQRALLAELGVTEDAMGCDIKASMDTQILAKNGLGLPIHFSRDALSADGIIVFNRIKPHTSFTGMFESGLMKMLAVGLGKQQGAAQVHKLGLPGLKALVPDVGSYLIAHTPVALGVAVLENARDRTAKIVPIAPRQIFHEEPRLLDEARALMPRIPFDQLDVLIVGELGKNYSGTGLDPNIIGRQRVETMPDLDLPSITRLAVLDVAPESKGNALGVGLADLTTNRLVQSIDYDPIRMNCFTSNFLTRARVPLSLESDREVLAACLDTCWRMNWDEARMAIIPNTLELTTLWVTPPLLEEAKANRSLAIDAAAHGPIPFNYRGNIDQEELFPDSVRGRRPLNRRKKKFA